MFSVEYLSLENSEVNANSQKFPFLRDIHNECVDKGVEFFMFISGFTIAVILYLDSYYLFDSHSRNGQGSMIPQDKSVLLKLKIKISDENISHVLNTFQSSKGATRQQRHRVEISKSQEFEDNVLHNFDKIIQGSCY